MAPWTRWSPFPDGKGMIILSPEEKVTLLQEGRKKRPSCCVSWDYGTLCPCIDSSCWSFRRCLPCWLVMRRKLNLQFVTGAKWSLVASISYSIWFFLGHSADFIDFCIFKCKIFKEWDFSRISSESRRLWWIVKDPLSVQAIFVGSSRACVHAHVQVYIFLIPMQRLEEDTGVPLCHFLPYSLETRFPHWD